MNAPHPPTGKTRAEQPRLDFETMQRNASDAVSLLKGLANESRLMIVCVLSEGELSVGQLNQRIKLSQSALSQHLAVLRAAALAGHSGGVGYYPRSGFVHLDTGRVRAW